MDEKTDIQNLEDIQLLVDSFYAKVRQDELLSPIFNGIIQDEWETHLEKMYRFWQTVLLEEHTYYGSPFRPHAPLPVSDQHFDRWKALFKETIDEHFVGKRASEALWRAEKMAAMFLTKIRYFQQPGNSMKPL
jgi:hemoglobin